MPLTFLTILIAIILRISVTSRVLRTLFFSPFYSPLLPPPTQCRDEKSLRRYCLGSSPFISKIPYQTDSMSLLQLLFAIQNTEFSLHSSQAILTMLKNLTLFLLLLIIFHHGNSLSIISLVICQALTCHIRQHF